MKFYISGKISGLNHSYAEQKFKEAELFLKSEGFDVVNPMTIPHDHDKSWESYMRQDLKAMLDCQGILMLDNWQDSRGAKIERDLAIDLGFIVKYHG